MIKSDNFKCSIGGIEVSGLNSINIPPQKMHPEILCGEHITFTGTFINPLEFELTNFSKLKNINTYAELNGIERRVSIDFDGGKIFMYDLLNGKKYEIN